MSKLSKLLGLDYRNERRVLAGKTLRVRTHSPAILFFSIHKAASSFANACLRRLTSAAGYRLVDLENYSFQHERQRPQLSREYIQPQGLYYGTLRQYFDPGDKAQLKIIVQVRDPRDAITSSYYSYRNSHRPPIHAGRRQEFEQNRRQLQCLTLDQYASLPDPPILQTLNNYAKNFFPDKDILIIHYEDMVHDLQDWLNRVCEYSGISSTRSVRRAMNRCLAEAETSEAGAEDRNRHKRQVQPGEHQRKLTGETIRTLNQTCSSYFERMMDHSRYSPSYSFPDFEVNPHRQTA